LGVPRPIAEVEGIEAWIKKSWKHIGVETLDERARARFAEFFLRLGFLPKYKSYGVKYAAPFGYTLFDLEDGGGFSIQLHETAKIEAFHILGVRPQAFVLLCTPAEWEKDGSEMVDLWNAGRPEASKLAYHPEAGDVAVVEDLSTVHTVVGCLVEEFATSSYDVVSRLYDQNLGREVLLPVAHRSVAAVLRDATMLQPRRRVRRLGQWESTQIPPGSAEITTLPDLGLVARHVVLSDSGSVAETVGSASVLTVFVLAGRVELDVDGARFEMRAGDVTALAPGSEYKLVGSAHEECRVSLCDVASDFAFADLR
jgi:mannose-6-phosphate isomerase-like protein (cupin superfamily)